MDPALLSLLQGRNQMHMQERSMPQKERASNNVREGFKTAVEEKNERSAKERRDKQTLLQKVLSDTSAAHLSLMNKVKTYDPELKTKNYNTYVSEMLTSDPSKVNVDSLGCYMNTSLTEQTDLVTNVNVDSCKMRAMDLGFAGFALGNGAGNSQNQKCYISKDLEKSKSGGVYMTPIVAHTLPVPANFTATGCRLGKDGQLMFFNTAGATAPATASKGFMGCDSVIGGGIKPVSASYGGNCVTTILNVLDAEKVTDELKTSTQEPSSYDQLTEEQRKEINQKFVSG